MMLGQLDLELLDLRREVLDLDDLFEHIVVGHRELDVDDFASLLFVLIDQFLNLLRFVFNYIDDVLPKISLELL
jgi:hypothetical protein